MFHAVLTGSLCSIQLVDGWLEGPRRLCPHGAVADRLGSTSVSPCGLSSGGLRVVASRKSVSRGGKLPDS